MDTKEKQSDPIKGFISDENLIQEDHRVEDLLDFSDAVNKFSQKLDTIKRPAIIGLVGKFGSGKSTMLYQVRKKREEDEIWIEFDAWKYPDRKNLWDGFVLDFAQQIGERKKAKRKLDGNGVASAAIEPMKLVLSGIPYVGNVLEMLKKFIESSPATRVFEIQEILNGLIEKQKKPICIVLEDIDRSGDAGIYFLQTLRQYIQKLDKARAMRVIVPIGDEEYEKNIQSYRKCLDYVESFRQSAVKLSVLVERIIDKEILASISHYKYKVVPKEIALDQTTSFLEQLFQREQHVMTPRLLKLILRKANMSYINQVSDGHEPDWRVTLCFESSKFFSNEQDTRKYFDLFKNTRQLRSGSVFYAFLMAMTMNSASILEPSGDSQAKQLISRPQTYKFVERPDRGDIREHPSHPWYIEPKYSDDKGTFAGCDFYLDY